MHGLQGTSRSRVGGLKLWTEDKVVEIDRIPPHRLFSALSITCSDMVMDMTVSYNFIQFLRYGLVLPATRAAECEDGVRLCLCDLL